MMRSPINIANQYQITRFRCLVGTSVFMLFLVVGCQQPEDCAGVANGTASIDDCGICSGGTTSLEANYLKDCLGECSGDAMEDCAGVCDGDAVEDCAGVCDGDAVEDDCGQCNGDNSDCPDCNGVVDGDYEIDACGNCYPASFLDYSCIDIEVLQDIIDVHPSIAGYMPLDIGDQTWVAGRLVELSIENYSLTIVPTSIGNLQNLERLEISYNQITQLPDGINALSYLNRLYLNNNELTSLPSGLCDLPNNCIVRVFDNILCEEYHLDCISFVEWGSQDETNCDCFDVTNGSAVLDECGICDGSGIPDDECTCFGDPVGSCPCSGLVGDLFISEYSEGSAPNQYIEIYNGTEGAIALDSYELWLVKGGSNMSWDSPDRVLLFNSLESHTDIELELGDDMISVDVTTLASGETLMILREAEDEDFDFVGGNYVVFSGLGQMGGDDAVALKKYGVIIDQVGEDTDPGTAWEVAGVSNATKNHTIIRKGTVISGNTNWSESAGTDENNSEWEVYDQDYFNDIFMHSCIPR